MRAERSGWERVLVVCLVVALSSSGCTLLGAGIGGIVGAVAYPSERVRPLPRPAPNAAEFASRFDVSKGDELELEMREGQRVRGEYRGLLGPRATDPETYVLVDEDSHRWGEPSTRKVSSQPPRRVPASEILRVRIELHNYGWAVGALIGLPLDVLALVALSSLRFE
jgi:hypothetical protein